MRDKIMFKLYNHHCICKEKKNEIHENIEAKVF